MFSNLRLFILASCLALLSGLVNSAHSSALLFDDASKRYDINSSPQASGFLPCDIGGRLLQGEPPTSRPDFRLNERYCLRIPIVNVTDQTDWVVHVSHYFYKDVRVTLEDQTLIPIYSDGSLKVPARVSYGPLGFDFNVSLEKQKVNSLLIELVADRLGLPSYIGLSAAPSHEQWLDRVVAIQLFAVAMIISFIIVALIFSIVLTDATFFWFSLSSFCVLVIYISTGPLPRVFDLNMSEQPFLAWFIVLLMNCSSLMFARTFASDDGLTGRLKNLFDCLILASVTSFIASFFVSNISVAVMFSVCVFFTLALILYVAVTNTFSGQRYYIIFLLGWVPFVAVFGQRVFLMLHVPKLGEVTLSQFPLWKYYAHILHMLLHFLAMVIRILKLKGAKFSAEAESAAKSTFLAGISHDLRQPMHSMAAYLDMVRPFITDKRGAEFHQRLSDLRSTMDASLCRLLDLSRLEAGRAKVSMETVQLDQLIEDIVLQCRPQAREKQLQLRLRLQPMTVQSDPLLLARIIRNLLANAIKYTRNGGILVALSYRQGAPVVRVFDTGCGIEPNDQATIFDPYQRLEPATKSAAGLGLGLAVVKRLADLLACDISVRSQPGRGSLFQLRLHQAPIAEARPSQHADSAPNDESQTAVSIVVDLDEMIREELNAMLSSWGYGTTELSSLSTNAAPLSKRLIIACANDSPTETVLIRQAEKYQSCYQNVHVAFLCEHVDQQLASRLQRLGVFLLTLPCRPTQLRSLIRYLESLIDGNIR